MTAKLIKHSVVPVVYMGGTGGHFVASLLNKAASGNIDDDHRLSKYGNCHSANLIPGGAGGPDTPLEVKINKLKMMDLITETDKIYYWPLETVKIDSVMIEFDRCVKITYTENDIDEIANVFYIKWGFEGNRLKRQLSGRQPDYQTWRVQRDSVLHWTNKFFCPDDEYGDRILNVSWYELYHANVDDVVEKLSKFTGTPSEKFNKDFIVCWRERTHFGLSKIDQLKILANR